MFFLFLELNGLRVAEFSYLENSWVLLREQKLLFPEGTLHSTALLQRIIKELLHIKKSWGLSSISLHCLLSSDFLFFRVTTFRRSFKSLSLTHFLREEVKKLSPVVTEAISIAYQKIGSTTKNGLQQIAYAAIKTHFLESLVTAIEETGCSITKIDLLPLSLYSTPTIFRDTFLLNITEKQLNLLFLSSKKNAESVYYTPLTISPSDTLPLDQKESFPLIVYFYLEKAFSSLTSYATPPISCLIIKNYFFEKNQTAFQVFLEKHHFSSFQPLDPGLILGPCCKKPSLINELFCRLLRQPFIAVVKRKVTEVFLKNLFEKIPILSLNKDHVTSIQQFNAPSISYREKSAYWFFLLILFFGLVAPLSLLGNYLASKKIASATIETAQKLSSYTLQLQQLEQDIEELKNCPTLGKNLSEYQRAQTLWLSLLTELQKCNPSPNIWITELTPKLQKEYQNIQEVVALEIKGLYLEGISGQKQLEEYLEKLATSSLFLPSRKENLMTSCAQEDGGSYAYSFSFSLPLRTPIKWAYEK